MNAVQWHKLLQMTFDEVNTYPDTASVSRDISKVKAAYIIEGQPDYDYSLEFSEDGVKYTPGQISNSTIQIVYPNLEVLMHTFMGMIPPAGSHAIIEGGVQFKGIASQAVLISALAVGFVGGFMTAQAMQDAESEE